MTGLEIAMMIYYILALILANICIYAACWKTKKGDFLLYTVTSPGWVVLACGFGIFLIPLFLVMWLVESLNGEE